MSQMTKVKIELKGAMIDSILLAILAMGFSFNHAALGNTFISILMGLVTYVNINSAYRRYALYKTLKEN